MSEPVFPTDPARINRVRVVIRADSASQIGMGHVMRCLTLASELRDRGVECIFICRQHPGECTSFIRDAGFEVRMLPVEQVSAPASVYAEWLGASSERDAEQTVEILKDLKRVDWVIVDHYATDATWHSIVRRQVNNLMVIDDLADRTYDCLLLLDQNADRVRDDYVSRTPADCELLIGHQYILLRREFSEWRNRSLARRNESGPISHILVSMARDDSRDITGKVVGVLASCQLPSDCRVSVLLGPNSPNRSEIENMELPFDCEVLCDVKEMAKLDADCDLAIAAGGSAAYERIYLGLPSLVIAIAENQVSPLKKLSELNALKYFESLEDLIDSLPVYLQRNLNIDSSLVRNGTTLVADRLLEKVVTLQAPVATDVRRTFHWLQDAELRRSFLMAEAPVRSRHFPYWRELLSDKTQRVFSVYVGGAHIGNAGIKNIDTNRKESELWLYLACQQIRGRRIGTAILENLLEYAREKLNHENVFVHVSSSNHAAIQLYKKFGFRDDSQPVDAAFAKHSETVKRMCKRL